MAKNLRDYVNGFSENVRKIIDRFDLDNQITRLAEAKLLYQVVGRFAAMRDLDKLSTHDMGYVFEHLIRKFYEDANETAGDHFTPREVIELMVNLLIAPDVDTIVGEGQVINILDPACGTGGMLTSAEDTIKSINPNARVYLFGQEFNARVVGDLRVRDAAARPARHASIFGNSFSEDGYPGRKFDYMLANPPFGVEWKKVKDEVEDEAELGHAGRFGAGLPRINDGSFLFLQHMISKMQPVEDGGSRLAIVFNGSPLFTGGAGSGESEIRRWILENDWLEGIVALPDQLFYNTGISTYFWILSNRKAAGAAWQGDPAGRPRPVGEDAQVPRRQAQGDQRGPDRARHQAVRERPRDRGRPWPSGPREGEDLRHAGLRLPPDHGRASAQAPLRDHRGHAGGPGSLEAAGQVGRARRPSRGPARLCSARCGGRRRKRRPRSTRLPASGGALWPSTASLLKAIWAAVSVSDPEGEVQTDKDGNPLPDPDLRDYENVPLDEDIDAYFAREVMPHVPDAWIDHEQDKDRLRDPLHSPFLCLHAAPAARRDRRRAPRTRIPNPETAR